ncbi:MAG: rhodanese-like domain-containing protein [Candidatus Peregrinibacteria bacterium]|nr:rhodanese-like domain-containing protein [Candidatus Peregrinibacteria bacterium]MDZ4244928.1 rhodanese-like domain-containing protein [Candidatus Gracilibacteria bacterium]
MKEITAKEFENILKEGHENALFLDVRTHGEYKACHINGLKNIPLDELSKHIEELKKYDTIYVSCGTGMRSRKGCVNLKSLGLTNVVNVQGGLEAWKLIGCPVNKGK